VAVDEFHPPGRSCRPSPIWSTEPGAPERMLMVPM
jgi:hypothetical protein